MIAHQAPAYGLTVHFCKNLCLEWGISEREREREREKTKLAMTGLPVILCSSI